MTPFIFHLSSFIFAFQNTRDTLPATTGNSAEVVPSTLTRYTGRFAAIAGLVVLLGGLAALGWLLAR